MFDYRIVGTNREEAETIVLGMFLVRELCEAAPDSSPEEIKAVKEKFVLATKIAKKYAKLYGVDGEECMAELKAGMSDPSVFTEA